MKCSLTTEPNVTHPLQLDVISLEATSKAKSEFVMALVWCLACFYSGRVNIWLVTQTFKSLESRISNSCNDHVGLQRSEMKEWKFKVQNFSICSYFMVGLLIYLFVLLDWKLCSVMTCVYNIQDLKPAVLAPWNFAWFLSNLRNIFNLKPF